MKTKRSIAPKKAEKKPELSELVIELIQDKKGKDIVCLDLTAIPEAVTDYFIICHGDSTTQTRAIADHLEEEVKERTKRKAHVEGRATGEWCLVDFGDVVVHIFTREKREFYQLEDLWHDAKAKRYAD